ncbi:hypothetical protein [uncultured Winogradskyella sp.]|uniref:hypothetical protein n=1 Tax=uncultured Winogradskyella sp. TaxID=395353 RepID=UPI0026126A38|nr:hypothetical protein [uncultured Winogradskyella sp.]
MMLNKDQIQQLYTFTQKHYVDWFDVQTELVDHLANGIENHLIQNPNATFEDALNTEFKKFGVTGFSDVIEEKTKALNTHYRKLVWQYFKDFFKLPKIILTLFLIYIFYQLFQFVDERLYILIPTAMVLFWVPLSYFIKSVKSIRKTKKETGKKWLFDNTALQLGELSHIFNIGIYGGIIFDSNKNWSNTQELIFSILMVGFALILYVSIYIVSPKLRNEAAKQHPDYKFA